MNMSSDGAELRGVTIRPTAPGRAEIVVDGLDIARHVAGAQINLGLDQPAEVLLRLTERYEGGEPLLDGLARVAVVVDEPLDPGPAAAAFLSAIDAEELERVVLNRLDLDNGPSGMTKTMLRQLVEWASGRP